MGTFDEIGASIGISSLVSRDELPQNMTNWLLKGNQEKSDPWKSRVYML
jgi:hypothetical protein